MNDELTPRMQQEEPSTDLVQTVFVYGTLKSGGQVRGVDMFGDHSEIQGKAKTEFPDYDMADLGGFPAVVLGGEHYIEGEVWKVSQWLADKIDDIEGYPTFYNKKKVPTSQGNAIMYFMDRESVEQYNVLQYDQTSSVEKIGDTLKWNL